MTKSAARQWREGLTELGRKLMANNSVLIRVMGESDIVDVDLIKTSSNAQNVSVLLGGLDRSDQINLLGHWMDYDRGASLFGDAVHLDAITHIASDIVTNSQLATQIDAGANFVLVTILREKWPVGSKSKLKVIADRVGANHTYLSHVCAATKLDDLGDRSALKQAETNQLSIALVFYRANRRRFANSSAIHGLIRA